MNKQNFFSNQQLFDVLILDAETRQSLVTIRSLGKRGLRIAALANFGKNAPAFSSRWCYKSITSPFPEGTNEYADFLLKYLQTNKAAVIIPSSDGTIAILRKYYNQLQKLTNIALAPERTLHIAINKNKTLVIAEKLKIKIPKSITIVNETQLQAALPTVSFPLVLKPNESWLENNIGSKRVNPMLAYTKHEAQAAFLELTHFGGEVILQEYLTGEREAVSVIYANKKFYAGFAQFAKRTQPPMGGTSVLRQSIAMPKDIYEQVEALIKAIDLEGYAEIEFRRDENGVPYLMEINPRLSASVEIAIRSGVDFPFLLYQWAVGEKISEITYYKAGIWERYLAGDLIHLAEAWQGHNQSKTKVLFDFFRSFLQPMYYDYIDRTDMKPAWNATKDFMVRNVKKLSLVIPTKRLFAYWRRGVISYHKSLKIAKT